MLKDIQEIGDKIVYNTIEEILDPSHIALVLWNIVYAFTNMIYNKEEFSRNLDSVVELARKSNIPISFTSHQMLSKRFESSNIYTASKLGLDHLFEQCDLKVSLDLLVGIVAKRQNHFLV